jgi:hypothetical protein
MHPMNMPGALSRRHLRLEEDDRHRTRTDRENCRVSATKKAYQRAPYLQHQPVDFVGMVDEHVTNPNVVCSRSDEIVDLD